MAVSTLLLLGTAHVAAAGAQSTCPCTTLPAYAHNDYENDHPLYDALRLGYSGVEADVYLVDGVVRVGHNRRGARRGGSLEALYLAPLRELAMRCGSLTSDGRPFLLTIESKEHSRTAYDSLRVVLARYADILSTISGDSLRAGPIEVVLVGWHPPPAELNRELLGRASVQARLTSPEWRETLADTTGLVRLISLDYGKAVGGRKTRAAERERWLRAIRGVKQAAPNCLLRVYNVPRDSTLYRALWAAGADLIGTKTIEQSRPALAPLARAPCRVGL